MARIPAPNILVQATLFQVEKQATVDGVEMGVLENGIPYLTESGLARMCGIHRKSLYELSSDWASEKQKPRGMKINALLEQSGYLEPNLFLPSQLNGTQVNAYTEPVCLALLEYYAFIAEEKKDQAVKAFRALARKTFRDFVYAATGYAPEQALLDSWRHLHDRLDMTTYAVPRGYFCVFNEISVMVVPMIRSGVLISDKVLPDISVGKTWSKFWTENGLDSKYGERTRFDHAYPDYYPQAKSNPQPSYAYPEEALGLFREWLRETYVLQKFPNYLLNQAKQGKIDQATAYKAIGAFSDPALN